jgi:RNA-directed DNA polymerase
MVILVDAHPRHRWLRGAIQRRLREELAKIQVVVNEEKTRVVDLSRGESFGFLGFEFRRIRSRSGKWMPLRTPLRKARRALLRRLKELFRHSRSQPTVKLIATINPILRGWVQYFAIGHSSRCFSFIRDWVEKKIRRHLNRARLRQGFGWKRWRRQWIHAGLGLYDDYRVRRYRPRPKAAPA